MANVRDRVEDLENGHRRELGRRLFVEWDDGRIFESGKRDREWSAVELAGLWAEGFQVILFKVEIDECKPGQSCERA